MSIALCKYMCQNITGTEEQVKTIRMMNNIRDSLNGGSEKVVITSGSFGEGLEMRGSDLDIMIVARFIEVTEDVNIQFISGTMYFTIALTDTTSCFTKLRFVHSDKPGILNICDKIGNDYYLSNSSVKQTVINKIYPTIHGPCISDKEGLCDFAYAVHSKSWIKLADQWITRSNNGWPDCDAKKSIVKHGVLFVPIGVKGSKNEELEWRISFSVGEKLLIHSFTHAQFMCYALMKILLKDVINIDPQCKELLCSYFIKTVIFWISEELSISIWKPENMISCFMKCFRRLIYCVEYSVCPHYFIPKYNLFENKIKEQSQQLLLDKLQNLISYGWQCILFSDQISNFDAITYTINKESRCLHIRSIEAFVYSMIHIADIFLWSNPFILEKGIHRISHIRSSNIKSLFTYYISKLCYKSHQLLQYGDISDNKYTYSRHKTSISTLLLGTHQNAVSGWLLLASFFYKTKEYTVAIDILQFCLLKCTQEKLHHGINLSHIHKELFKLHLFREMTIAQLSKFMFLGSVILLPNSQVVPDELQIEDEKYSLHFSPVVYTHFLRFLCHFRLHNPVQCRDSLRDLQLTIAGNYFMTSLLQMASSYNLLGIIFQLVGETDSARQAFLQSLELVPDPDQNNASIRMSLVD